MANPLEGITDDTRITIAGREITALSREKTIVLALLIQLFIAAFSSFLVVGLTSLYDPGAVEGEIEIAVSGEQQDELLRAAEQRDTIEMTAYEDSAAARQAYENGEVDAVITARNLETERGNRIAVDATVPAEGFGSTIVVVQIRQVLFELERNERTQRLAYLDFEPVNMPEEQEDTSGFTQYFTFTYTILIPLLLLVSAVTGITVVIGLLLGLLTGSRREAQLLYSMLVLALFGAAALLPEHPATTAAKLAVDSPTLGTFAHVGLFTAIAIGGYLLTRWYVHSLDPESL